MKTHGYSLFAAFLLTTFLIFVIPGCNGDGNGNDNSSDSPTGTLRVSLTDAPACGFDAVNVTVSKVRVHQNRNATENAAGWAEIILDPPRKINLLDLTNGVLEELGETPLAAGRYTQLRLVLAESNGTIPANSVVPTGTTNEIELKTPSAMQSGLKLINEFEVVAGERVDLVLDFDACRSVVQRGNGSYGLKPVMRMVPFTVSGIGGFVAPLDTVTVSAQSSGTVVRSTVANPLTGEFFLAHLAPGNYDVVITADDHATTVIAGVPITSAASTAMLSSSTTPITLPASATHSISGMITLNPPSSSTEVGEVTATQTFPSGPTVVVTAQPVELFPNPYTSFLPSAAPLLGQYGTGILPITLTAQTAVAGQYRIAVSVPGYQPQAFTKDIALGNATQNFALTP